MNALAQHNALRLREVEALRDGQIAAHRSRELPELGGYPLPRLKARIAEALSARWGKGRLDPHIELIDRATYGGDLAVKLPQLLSDGGPKKFIAEHQPWIVEILQSEAFADAIAAVRVKGMYINLTLSDRWLLGAAQVVADLGTRFGMSGAH